MSVDRNVNYGMKAALHIPDILEDLNCRGYTFADILYSALRVPAKERGVSVSWIRELKDEDLCKYIENILKNEKE